MNDIPYWVPLACSGILGAAWVIVEIIKNHTRCMELQTERKLAEMERDKPTHEHKWVKDGPRSAIWGHDQLNRYGVPGALPLRYDQGVRCEVCGLMKKFTDVGGDDGDKKKDAP